MSGEVFEVPAALAASAFIDNDKGFQAWRRNRESDDITKVTHATFTFVAIDRERKPRPLPPPDDPQKPPA